MQTAIEIAAAVGALVAAGLVALLMAENLAAELLFSGFFSSAIAISRALELVPFGAFRNAGADLEATALNAQGRPEEGLARIARAVETERSPVRRACIVNTAVNAAIAAGKYARALELAEEATPALRGKPLAAARQDWLLVRLNVAEALYNLGRWDEAWGAVPSDEEVEDNALLAGAVRMQRAWILAHRGAGAEAIALLDRVHDGDLPRLYRSELHFTRAAALLALGALDGARGEVERALRLAKRASSTRNGIFLLGRIALASGNVAEAERLFREGAGHPYRGQGGDGLLLWGDCLQQMGRVDEAMAAWRLAMERDPESESAGVANQRIDARRAEQSQPPV